MKIYTVGIEKQYDELLKEKDCPTKKGKDEYYKGGCAFNSINEANEYKRNKYGSAHEDYAVYLLEGNYEEDTYKINVDDNPFLKMMSDKVARVRIKRNLEIIKKV